MIVTRELLDLLRSRRIFLSYQGHDRWSVGDAFGFADGCALEPYGQIFDGHYLPAAFGAFSYSHSALNRHLRVGRYCSLAKNIAWMGAAHPTAWVSSSPTFFDNGLPATRAFRQGRGLDYPIADFPPTDPTVTIGHDVWIGDEVMIAPGVTIGHGAILGARALVLQDVPPYALVVGHPARIVRYRVPEALIPRFLDLQWWRYTPDRLNLLPAREPERFLDGFEEMIARDPSGQISPVMLTAREIQAAAQV
jgi:acetyltransferase-like isoleucine patch superfamily enzyme